MSLTNILQGNLKYLEAFKLTMEYVPLASRLYHILIAWELESVFYSFHMNTSGANNA